MDRLKRDVLDELIRDKNFIELDNARLSQNPIINYREMVNKIKDNLETIAIINGTLGLLEVYFPEPKQKDIPSQPQGDTIAEAPDKDDTVPQVVNEPVVEETVVVEPIPVKDVKGKPAVKAPVVSKVKARKSPFPKISK
jgi:hypothetical protein